MDIIDKVKEKVSDLMPGAKKNEDTGVESSGMMTGAAGESPVHDTTAGEMPDPGKMPSQTEFHTDVKQNV